MPVKVTITLDSGSFLPKTDSFCRIGYFECEAKTSDIQIRVDNNVPQGLPDPFKLGKGCVIEVRHKDALGKVKKDGVRTAATFGKALLRLKDLYGVDVPTSSNNFDCEIVFFSGELAPLEIRDRHFKEHKKQADGSYVLVAGAPTKPAGKAIMHDCSVTYSLDDDESIELARDDKTLWSSEGLGAKQKIDIKILADHSTVTKFFGDAFAGQQTTYWMPNPDPPPTCPSPPCPESP